MRWQNAAKLLSLVAGGSVALVMILVCLTKPDSEDAQDAGADPSEILGDPPVADGASVAPKAATGEEKSKGGQDNLLLRKRVHQLLASVRPPAAELAARIAAAVEDIRQGNSSFWCCSGLAPEELNEVAFGLVSPDFTKLRSLGLVGCGGFSKVELVEHPDAEPRAWKVMNKAQVHKSGMVDNVLTERLVLAATSFSPSPFIISYFGCCQSANNLYFQLEHGIGGELYSVYKREKLFGSEEHAKYYMACACSAISHMHNLHVILRSLKPEDCALNAEGRLKLIDFGLSKFIVDRTFTTCGTPDYFAPEIIACSGHSFDVDWWSVGVMTFELLAGSPPFESATPFQIYTKVIRGIDKIEFPASVRQEASELIHQLCAKIPEQRLAAGVDSLAEHGFFQPLGRWEGLAGMTPPFKPTVENGPLSNFSPSESDIPQYFASKPETPTMPEYEVFGPEGSLDEFPTAE